jgi:Spy/CpxP family protein refolding chaperone
MVEPTVPRPTRGVLVVIAIFALGIVFGVALFFAIAHHFWPGPFGPPRGGPVALERMTHELDLDSAQREEVRAILERGHAKMRRLLDETRLDIRAILRPDQQEKLDRIRPPRPLFPPPEGGPGGPPPVPPR